MGWSDGMARLFPAWELVIGDYRIPAAFWATAAFLPLFFVLAGAYPYIERKMTGDNALHNLLQRPRDAPVRTALGAMAITAYVVLLVSSANDWFAFFFDVSLNATTWMGRVGLLVLPPIVYWVTYRWCLGLQRSDRQVLEHGVETGIVRRLPHGEFIEIHQPLAGVDHHGHPIPLEYQGAPVPKKMNALGSAGSSVPGSLAKPDPARETAALGPIWSDRQVLEPGVEPGIVRRLPHGEFIEIHQPLAGVDHHGHPIPLEYQGAPVPKKMNALGSAGSPVPGSLTKPDPARETAALERARRELMAAEARGHRDNEGDAKRPAH